MTRDSPSETYQPAFSCRLPPALTSHLIKTVPQPPFRPSDPGPSTSPERPKIKLTLSHHTTTGDFSSYSALSPVHVHGSSRNTHTPRTIYAQLLPAAARSTETLPSPARLRSPIPISTSSTYLPLSTPPPTWGTYRDDTTPEEDEPAAAGGVGRKPSTMSTLLNGLSGKWGAWKKQERARLQTIHKQRMSNGTANFYFPPEEQDWDPKAIKRLSKIGQRA